MSNSWTTKAFLWTVSIQSVPRNVFFTLLANLVVS